MKNRLFITATLISTVMFDVSYAQVFQGKIIDKETSAPLSYANIGIIGKNIGGISFEDGSFHIDLGQALPGDSVRISYLGYKAVTYLKNSIDFSKVYSISLQQVPHLLHQVTVYSKRENFKIGNDQSSFRYTGWGDFKTSRGRTRGFMMHTDECLAVKDFNFRIHDNNWDSVKFRLNILDAGNLHDHLLSRNIFITTSKKSGWVKFDLEKYNVVLCQDFVVALEWVDAWGKIQTGENAVSNLLTFSLSKNKGETYYRDTPDERVKLTDADFTPAMYFDVYRMGTKSVK